MVSFLKAKARKPLASGTPTISYGVRHGVNDGRRGVTLTMHSEDGRTYSVHIEDEELDRLIEMRETFRKEFEA